MSGYTVSLAAFKPTEQLATPLRPAQQRLFERIVAEDGVVLETYGEPPVRTERYAEHDGSYYRVDFEQVGTEEVQARRGGLSWEKGQEPPADARVLAYPDLPDVDQHVIDFLLYGPEHSRRELPTQGLTVQDSPVPYPNGTEDSELVGAGTTWVERDGRVYDVNISTEKATITKRTYDYEATRVGDTAKAFREYVVDRYLAPLTGLSDETRRILDAAVEADGRYEDCNEPSDGYEELEQRLAELPELPEPQTSHWYVVYEAERYLLEVGRWVV